MLQNKLKTHFHIPFNRIWYWPFQETNITYSFFFIIVSISLQLMNELTLDERSTILKRPFCYLFLWNSNKNCSLLNRHIFANKNKLVLPTSSCLYFCLQWQLLLCKLKMLHTFRTVCFLSDKYAIGSWQIVKRLARRVFCDNRSTRQAVSPHF